MSLKTFEFLFKYNNGVYELFSSPAGGTQSANKRSEVPTWFCTARVYCTSFVGNEFKNVLYHFNQARPLVDGFSSPCVAPTWFGE